jgi:hypothetical protein
MEANKNVREVVKWCINVKWNGEWRKSPEYDTEQQACDNIVPFLKQMKGKYLNVTIVRETRFEAAQ